MQTTQYSYVVQQPQELSKSKRLVSMFLDHVIMTFVAVAGFIPGIIYSIISSVNDSPTIGNGMGAFVYVGMIGIALYLCKDSFDGRSAAKRILKLQVIDNKTGLAASPLKCFVRNLTLIIWPLEVIMILANPSKRIGDRISGTHVVNYDPALEKVPVNFAKLLLPFAICYSIILLISFYLPSAPKASFIEESYNAKESKLLEERLNQTMQQHFTASVKVYDSVKNSPNKFAYISLRLKENYIYDDASLNGFKEILYPVLQETFPPSEFEGYIKYSFSSAGSFHSTSMKLY